VERSMLGLGAFGATLGLGALLGAPILVHVLLGPGYEAAIPVVRALAPLPLIAALGTVLGLYWAIPFGHERSFLAVVTIAGVLNLGLAALLVPLHGAMGMAGAVIFSEAFVTLALAMLYVRHREETVPIPRGAPA
jgi:PST family polysaccharide transporter